MSLLDRTEVLEARVRAIEAKLLAEFPPAAVPEAGHLPGHADEEDEDHPAKRGSKR